MNKVKFVPADPKVRALAAPEVLVMECTQTARIFRRPLFRLFKRIRRPTVREAEILAGRRGWTRLAYLPKPERARYAKAKEVRG